MASTEYNNAVSLANANAGGFVTLAKTALAAAQEAVAAAGFDDVTWTPIIPPPGPNLDDVPAPPNIDNPGINLPTAPGDAPDMQDIPGIEFGQEPALTAVSPTLEFGSTPSGLGATPTAPSIITSFVFPTAPAALSDVLPQAPNFTDRTAPTSPEMLVPQFSSAEPLQPEAPPSDGAQIMATNFAYQSLSMKTNVDASVRAYINEHSPNYFTQMASVEAQLAKYLAGGTGIDAVVEAAIYQNAVDRNDREAARVRDAAYAEAASRGFTLPPGALVSAVARARQLNLL